MCPTLHCTTLAHPSHCSFHCPFLALAFSTLSCQFSMGRHREPINPTKHTRCKCGWFYNKNLPAHKLEQHKKGPQHQMFEQDERMRSSLIQHMVPIPPPDEDDDMLAANEGDVDEPGDHEGINAQPAPLAFFEGDRPLCVGVRPLGMEDKAVFMGYYPFHLHSGPIDLESLTQHPELKMLLTKRPVAFTWEFGAESLFDLGCFFFVDPPGEDGAPPCIRIPRHRCSSSAM